MASPSFDSTFGVTSFGNISGTSSGVKSVVNKTGGTNRVVCVAVFYEITTGTPSVTSITESSSVLTFSKYASIVNTTSGAHRMAIELWTAPASAVWNSTGSNLNLTVNWGTAIDDACIVFFAIEGCFSITSPFDSEGAASNFNTTSTTPPSVNVHSNQSDDLFLFMTGNAAGSTSSTPSGWTLEANPNNGGGTNDCYTGTYSLSVSSAQSTTVKDASSANQVSWTGLVVAFTADNNSGAASASVSMALGKAAFSAAGGSRSGAVSFALGKAAFAVGEAEGDHGAASFALSKAKFSILTSILQGATSVVGPQVLRVVRGIRDTITGGSIVGRVPGAAGGAQVIPVTMIADQVGHILAGGTTNSPTAKSAGAAALAKQAGAIANEAVATRIVGSSVVSGLPAGSDGLRGFVTDSTQTLAAGIGTAVVGGGGDHVPVYFDGSSSTWMIG